jgi:hypothetical protein
MLRKAGLFGSEGAVEKDQLNWHLVGGLPYVTYGFCGSPGLRRPGLPCIPVVITAPPTTGRGQRRVSPLYLSQHPVHTAPLEPAQC